MCRSLPVRFDPCQAGRVQEGFAEVQSRASVQDTEEHHAATRMTWKLECQLLPRLSCIPAQGTGLGSGNSQAFDCSACMDLRPADRAQCVFRRCFHQLALCLKLFLLHVLHSFAIRFFCGSGVWPTSTIQDVVASAVNPGRPRVFCSNDFGTCQKLYFYG